MSDYRHIMTGPKAGLRFRMAQGDSTGKVWHSIQGRAGSANEKNSAALLYRKLQGQGRSMLPKLASWARDLCRHSPVGLGHETWAFWPCQAGFMSLADCPDHARVWTARGPTQGFGASLDLPLGTMRVTERNSGKPSTEEVDGPRKRMFVG